MTKPTNNLCIKLTIISHQYPVFECLLLCNIIYVPFLKIILTDLYSKYRYGIFYILENSSVILYTRRISVGNVLGFFFFKFILYEVLVLYFDKTRSPTYWLRKPIGLHIKGLRPYAVTARNYVTVFRLKYNIYNLCNVKVFDLTEVYKVVLAGSQIYSFCKLFFGFFFSLFSKYWWLLKRRDYRRSKIFIIIFLYG